MRIIWSAKAQYRAFFEPASKVISLVSSNLAEEAVGRLVSGGLTLVVDNQDGFTDLELILNSKHRQSMPAWEQQPTEIKDTLKTILPPDRTVSWQFNERSGDLLIYFTPSGSNYWFQIGSRPIFIGTEDREKISAIVFKGVVEDPNGELESAWLDQIEETI